MNHPCTVWFGFETVCSSLSYFDFQPSENDDKKDHAFADDSFLMVSQLHWEDDVVWNGEDIKQKVASDFYHPYIFNYFVITCNSIFLCLNHIASGQSETQF